MRSTTRPVTTAATRATASRPKRLKEPLVSWRWRRRGIGMGRSSRRSSRSIRHASQGSTDLKLIYTAATDGEAEQRLVDFSLKWDSKFPMIAKSWHSNWARVIPFFAHPPEIRKVIYTTNAIESLNMSLRKVTKARGSFPNDEAVCKLL